MRHFLQECCFAVASFSSACGRARCSLFNLVTGCETPMQNTGCETPEEDTRCETWVLDTGCEIVGVATAKEEPLCWKSKVSRSLLESFQGIALNHFHCLTAMASVR